jgi:hypothetical protein
MISDRFANRSANPPSGTRPSLTSEGSLCWFVRGRNWPQLGISSLTYCQSERRAVGLALGELHAGLPDGRRIERTADGTCRACR